MKNYGGLKLHKYKSYFINVFICRRYVYIAGLLVKRHI